MRVRALSWLPLVLLSTACGAKTGLIAPELEAGADALDVLDATDAFDGSDAPDGSDVRFQLDTPRITRPARCFPLRVHTQVGFVTSLQPNTEGITEFDTGYMWSLLSQPAGPPDDTLFSDGSQIANLSPSKPGTYELQVQVPRPDATMPLVCAITVIVDPIDPECPGYSLAEPRPIAIPNGRSQVAFDIVWSDPRTSAGAGAGAVASEDTQARVSMAAVEQPSSGSLDSEGQRAEDAVLNNLHGTPVFVGRTSATHDGFPLRRSTFRVDQDAATTPDALRDQFISLVAPGLSAPPADPFEVHAPARAFYVEVATELRTDVGRKVTLYAVSPVAAFDDNAQVTSIRVNDIGNATAVAKSDATLAVLCHAVTATHALRADFLWLVDTSGSMSDDQERVGDTAQQFFSEMNNAGADFRVGVLQAGHTRPNIESGFSWIMGSSANGARDMAWEVTEEAYHGDPADNKQPFRVTGDDEEPMAAAVESVKVFESPATSPSLAFRADSARVVFFVTDEPGSNDVDRYFANNPIWGAPDPAALRSNISNFFTSRNILAFGLVPRAGDCTTVDDLPACVVTTAGGAVIPIDLGSDAESQRQLQSAMNRVVDAVTGAASEFVLERVPISSSLRARVDNRIAPRSRSDGFDYEERSRALVFRGPTFRPMMGQLVRAAYFVWQ